MRKIDNQDFQTAFDDKDNQRIISVVCRRYSKLIPYDELKSCGYMAVYRCLQSHDNHKFTKFTSSLYRHVEWQCKKMVRELSNYQSVQFDYESYYVNSNEVLYVQDCLDLLPLKHKDLLNSYYIKGMTLKEIGDKNGYSPPAAFQKLEQAKEAFRRLYGED